jgi:hypothetical protein
LKQQNHASSEETPCSENVPETISSIHGPIFSSFFHSRNYDETRDIGSNAKAVFQQEQP